LDISVNNATIYWYLKHVITARRYFVLLFFWLELFVLLYSCNETSTNDVYSGKEPAIVMTSLIAFGNNLSTFPQLLFAAAKASLDGSEGKLIVIILMSSMAFLTLFQFLTVVARLRTISLL